MTATATKRFGVVELFAGAGGLALGFEAEGSFDLIALSDIEQSARNTFVANYPNVSYLCEDVRRLSVKSLQKQAAGRVIHGLLGGPPCQGFSQAGRRNPEDERNEYITEYARFVKELKPYFLLMENVPHVLYHQRFRDLLEELSQEYEVVCSVLNAAHYGVPQTRQRTFILAFRRDLNLTPTFPTPTHGFVERDAFNYHARRMERPTRDQAVLNDIFGFDPFLRNHLHKIGQRDTSREISPHVLSPLRNVWDAIGDLPSEPPYAVNPNPKDKRTCLLDNCGIPNHLQRRHDARTLHLTKLIKEGDDLRSVKDASLLPKSHFSQAYGRLHRSGLARTITTFFCNPGSGRFLHPVVNRALTVREAARLQGFSDDYVFVGTQSEQMRLVGNAVPPILAQALAKHIANSVQLQGLNP